MSRTVWPFQFTTLSPLMHGDRHEKVGQNSFTVIRRLRFLGPASDNTDKPYAVYSTPVISGNSLGGLLRRQARDLLLDACKLSAEHDFAPNPKMRSTWHLLSSGGALGAKGVMDYKVRAAIRLLFPNLSLFGFSDGSDMMAGRVSIGIALPAAQSLKHFFPGLSDADLRQLLEDFDPLDTELVMADTRRWTEYRHPDNELVPLVPPASEDADKENGKATGAAPATNATASTKPKAPKALGREMPVSSEYVPPGVPFLALITADPDTSALELSCLGAAWNRLAIEHPWLGGRRHVGMGRVDIALPNDPRLNPALFHQHLADHTEELRAALLDPKGLIVHLSPKKPKGNDSDAGESDQEAQ